MTTNMTVGLLALLLLAMVAYLGWDMLKLWWAGLLDTRAPKGTPPEIGRIPPPPRHLNEGAHLAVPRAPAFHRSGRRSSQ